MKNLTWAELRADLFLKGRRQRLEGRENPTFDGSQLSDRIAGSGWWSGTRRRDAEDLLRRGEPYLQMGFRGDAGPEHKALVDELRADGLRTSVDELTVYDVEGNTIGGPNFYEPDR